MNSPKKSLGQHWLHDESALVAVVEAAAVEPNDTVLEIGPGLGTLTEVLLRKAKRVIAVELDDELAENLARQNSSPKLQIINADILKFDLTALPPDYKVVANIPYYLTSNLLRVLAESPNPPAAMALLVQKEVAERIAAAPGQMSLLSVSVQLYYQPHLGRLVPAEFFTPPPKVDSQIIILTRRQEPLFLNLETKGFFQVVKAGFAGRRKKLRSSLAAGLRLSKPEADDILKKAGINGDCRAQELTLEQWHKIYLALPRSSNT